MFRNWVLQTFPFIEDDFDALTDYELFCKVMEYIKNYQKEFDRIEKEIKDFEEYINNFNIEETVNEILDERLPALENNILSQVEIMINILNNTINEKIDELRDETLEELDVLSNKITSLENGNLNIYNPTNGEINTLKDTLQDIFNTFLDTTATAITCNEFDALELTATEFDAYEITAIDFDLKAKEILI